MPFGKRQNDPEGGKSSGPLNQQASQDWIKWLHTVANFHVNTLPTKSRIDDRIYIQVDILGRKFPALVDTGAMLSFISDDVADHLTSQGFYPIQSKVVICLADSRKVESNEKFIFPGQIDNHEIEVEAVYLHGLTSPIILGIDYIKKLRLVQINLPRAINDQGDCLKKVELFALVNLTVDQQKKLDDFLVHELPLLETKTFLLMFEFFRLRFDVRV